VVGLTKLSFADRIATAVTAGGAYLLKLVYPSNLAVFYPHAQNLGTLFIILSSAMLVVATIIGCILWKQRPFILMGWLWFLGTLVPVSGLVQVGMQGMADRYTYLPFVGLFIVVVWCAHEFVARAQSGGMLGAVAGFLSLLACAIGARNQAAIWKDSGTLFRHALKVTRDNTVAHLHLGNYLLMQEGDIPQAIIHLQEAARLEPNLAEAHSQLGSALFLAGRKEESIKEFELTLLLNPLHTQAQCNLGVALQAVGRLPEAIIHLQEAVRLRPDYAEAQNDLGGALAASGRLEEAIVHLREAVRLSPGHEVAHRNLAQALLLHGERDEAMMHLRRAVELQPKDQQALRALQMLEGKAGH
jgi:Flp pilus assembly protein TadD